MKYMLLIYSSDAEWAALSPGERERGYGAYRAFSEELAASGKMVSGSELAPAVTAKSVDMRGSARITDGPYADTKEQLGGYYLIDVEGEAEAVAWAKKCPGAHHGVVEVRALI